MAQRQKRRRLDTDSPSSPLIDEPGPGDDFLKDGLIGNPFAWGWSDGEVRGFIPERLDDEDDSGLFLADMPPFNLEEHVDHLAAPGISSQGENGFISDLARQWGGAADALADGA